MIENAIKTSLAVRIVYTILVLCLGIFITLYFNDSIHFESGIIVALENKSINTDVIISQIGNFYTNIITILIAIIALAQILTVCYYNNISKRSVEENVHDTIHTEYVNSIISNKAQFILEKINHKEFTSLIVNDEMTKRTSSLNNDINELQMKIEEYEEMINDLKKRLENIEQNRDFSGKIELN